MEEEQKVIEEINRLLKKAKLWQLMKIYRLARGIVS